MTKFKEIYQNTKKLLVKLVYVNFIAIFTYILISTHTIYFEIDKYWLKIGIDWDGTRNESVEQLIRRTELELKDTELLLQDAKNRGLIE